MLELISRFTDYCDVTLSLNENEFEIICQALEIPLDLAGIENAGKGLQNVCPVKYLVVHLLNGAYAIDDNTCCFTENRYVKEPMISTGGGDNFNAGLSYGIMIGMDIRCAMALANAASGYCVTWGHSADLNELTQYLYLWRDEKREVS